MRKVTMLWLITLLALAGCGTETGTGTNENDNGNNDSGQEVQMGDVFTLAVGDEAFIAAEDLHLRFDSVLEDSRCPTTVTCVWAGQAVVSVSIWQGPAEPTNLSFNTNPAPEENVQEPTYQGFTIQLESLDPLPADSVAIPEQEYRATFVVNPSG